MARHKVVLVKRELRKRWSMAPWLVAVIALTPVSAYATDDPASIVWRQDFRSAEVGPVSNDWVGDLGEYRSSVSSSSSAAYHVADVTYSGDLALKFHVPGNSNGGSDIDFRSEITTRGYNRGETNWEGSTHWIGWAFKLAGDYPTNEDVNSRTVIFQTHRIANDVGRSPTWGLRVQGDGSMVLTQEFISAPNTRIPLPIRADDIRGKWVRAIVQVKYHGSEGFIRVWMDDVLVLDRFNVTTWEPEAEYFG